MVPFKNPQDKTDYQREYMRKLRADIKLKAQENKDATI
jgi:hypothetical protein